MTKDDQVDHSLEEVPSDNAQQQERSFHIVLVNIKKAAKHRYIHCVEKPLEGDRDLKFVALSYRRGEGQETTVDTRLGYNASVTSFDLNHFYRLCYNMTRDTNLRHMKYVWVDAICVDQVNPMKRKATIYHMTNIYERANYIVAVPDLHLTYLENSSEKNAEIIAGFKKYREYIYHLIHGNIYLLGEFDEKWLDEIGVPKNPHLRRMLTKYTDHFATGFIKRIYHEKGYNAKHALDHIFATNPASCRAPSNGLNGMDNDKLTTTEALHTLDVDKLHICDTVKGKCPMTIFDDKMFEYGTNIFDDKMLEYGIFIEQPKDYKWKQAISERSDSIRQSMYFLMDLIRDWSTRVWVISEINIARKKKNNKMKFWFVLLDGTYDRYPFFEFDFSGNLPPSRGGGSIGYVAQNFCSDLVRFQDYVQKSNAVYQLFHLAMRRQLLQQSFLEMILKSKASQNEDRFHAILPISQYKHKLLSQDQVDHWNIHSLVSVKLQLYEWMTTKNKLELLILSSNGANVGASLPTFATSNIVWADPVRYPHLGRSCNFNLCNPSVIVLTQQQLKNNNGNACTYTLNIKPRTYYRSLFRDQKNRTLEEFDSVLRSLAQLNLPDDPIDLISIPVTDPRIVRGMMSTAGNDKYSIILAGSFVKNKWIVCDNIFQHRPYRHTADWEFCRTDKNNGAGFDIY